LLTLDKSAIITLEESALLDKKAVSINNISPIDLMEEATEKILDRMVIDISDLKKRKIAILAGSGNNGGDALSLARKLFKKGINSDIYLLSDKKGSELFEIQKNKLQKININLHNIAALKDKIDNYNLIIDGLFGIGYSYRKNDLFEKTVELVNNSGAEIISIDIPSGLDVDDHTAINAFDTYSIGYLKNIFFNIITRKSVGNICDLKISFDIKNITPSMDSFYINKFPQLVRKTDNYVHKYKRGGCISVGGDAGKLGSIIFASKSALRIGAGISLVISDKDNVIPINKMSEEIIVDEYKNIKNYLQKYQSVIIGPGLNFKNKEDAKFIEDMLTEDFSFLFDASFFTIYKKDILNNIKHPPLLTPHTQEFISFFGDEATDLKKDTLSTVSSIAQKYRSYIYGVNL